MFEVPTKKGQIIYWHMRHLDVVKLLDRSVAIHVDFLIQAGHKNV